MASHVLYDAVILYEGLVLSSYLNQVNVNYSARQLDDSSFGDATMVNKAGILEASASVVGKWDPGATGDPDSTLFSDVGSDDKVFSVFPQGATAGSRGFSMQTSRALYTPAGNWGELFTFNAEGNSRSRLVQGTVLDYGTETSTDTGTARQVGAVASNQKLYAVLHVTATSGSAQTLDVILRSDDAEGMSSPTTRITFSQVTTSVGAQYATPVDGAITDDWWQASWTIGGSTPSFTFLVAMGIMYNLGQDLT